MSPTDHQPTEIIDLEDTKMNGLEDVEPLEPRAKLRIGYLVMGLLFIGIAGLWLLGNQGLLTAADFTLAGPIVLIIAGSLGLLASVINRARGTES